jgi:glucose/arabinose dehydrogenase
VSSRLNILPAIACLAALALFAAPAAAGDPGAQAAKKKRGGKVKLKRIGRFHQPVYVATAPGVEGIFVVEQGGRIKLVQGKARHTFLNIAGMVRAGGEQGLLSVAFPPDFATSRLFYVYFTNNAGDQEIAEFRAGPDGRSAEPGSLREVLVVPHPTHTNHNGGQLQFGPDGLLYIGTGDGGGGGDGPDNAQSNNTILGKILRIDPRAQGGQPYATPSTNPFAGGAGRDEIYSLGLRNPFRFSFDLVSSPGEPRIVIGDVGQDRFEEIDYETLAAANGANFGWNDFEGFAPFAGAHPPAPSRHDRPIKVYRLTRAACALIGGYVVRDPSLRPILGRYVYGDFCVGKLRSLIPALGGARKDRSLGVRVEMLSSFGEGAGGALYATSLRGPVYRIVRGRR